MGIERSSSEEYYFNQGYRSRIYFLLAIKENQFDSGTCVKLPARGCLPGVSRGRCPSLAVACYTAVRTHATCSTAPDRDSICYDLRT